MRTVVSTKEQKECQMKRAVLIIAVITMLAGFWCVNANASEWVYCDVNGFAQAGEVTLINLTDHYYGNFTSRWFTANTTKAREILAIAMFANTNGRVAVALVSSTDQFSTLLGLYIS